MTITAYNNHAEAFADTFMDFESYREKICLFQKQYIKKNARILDVGCGPGNNAKILSELDPTYIIKGLDLSAEMIALAKQNAPKCTFSVQDIRNITEDTTFDTIIASFCIVHLSDAETASLLHNLSNMLAENGTLYLSFMEGKKAGPEKTSFSEDTIFFNYYDRHTINKLLARYSFETCELLQDGYQEEDGSVTRDIFIFARKKKYDIF